MIEDKMWNGLVQKRAQDIVDHYRKQCVELRMEHLEKMLAAYLLATDIDPSEVVLVEEHPGTFSPDGFAIRYYYARREDVEDKE